MNNESIYLDYQSTTPCDKRVLEAMLPYFCEVFGNPHSKSHKYGWVAEDAVENARIKIANLINANSKDIVFTSGATESNNIAIKGVANFYKSSKNHIITASTEHKSVLDTCRSLEEDGFKVTFLPVLKSGLIDLEVLKQSITDKTSIVSIMAINNEIGVIQPLKEIGAICKEKGVFFHTDVAQAAGKIPIDVEDMNIDLLSISGHKMYAPKGIGALYVRRKPRVRLKALFSGGDQERGIRPGTLATPLCVGLGKACEIAQEQMQKDYENISALSSKMLKKLQNELEDIYINGDITSRYPGNLNISFAYVEGEGLMMAIKSLALSSGSACTSSSLEPSYVLKAIGIGDDLSHTSLRIGIGRFSTAEEIDSACDTIIKAVTKLRSMSPLWDMKQEGIDISKIQWASSH